MTPLLGITPEDISYLPVLAAEKPEVVQRILYWLYRRKISDWDAMNDIPKAVRKRIAENHSTGLQAPVKRIVSNDESIKYLFMVKGKGMVETVYIPQGKRHTVCVSVQAGCRMGCRFCQTAKIGFKGNLTASEIINQVCSIPESPFVTHIVFMGMGEPLDNYDEVCRTLKVFSNNWGLGLGPGHITLSTVGRLEGIPRFLQESKSHLALSIHTPFAEERKIWIPSEETNPISDILGLIHRFPKEKKRRISAEYMMVKDVNDSEDHLKSLIELLQNTALRVNLIQFNPVPHLTWQPAGPERIMTFFKNLNKAGVSTTVRNSRGLDIGAACGLLGRN